MKVVYIFGLIQLTQSRLADRSYIMYQFFRIAGSCRVLCFERLQDCVVVLLSQVLLLTHGACGGQELEECWNLCSFGPPVFPVGFFLGFQDVGTPNLVSHRCIAVSLSLKKFFHTCIDKITTKAELLWLTWGLLAVSFLPTLYPLFPPAWFWF